MNIIEMKNVKKGFSDFELNIDSLTVPQGYVMGLIGANGAGKTTLIKIIMGLYLRDTGEISIFGKDPRTDEKNIKEDIGFVFDEPKFYDFNLKKIKNIIAPFYKNWDDEQFEYYLKKFDLKGTLKFKKMSRGMKLKFALAIALSHHAKLLILDEPTSGLDPVFRVEFLALLQEIIEDGGTSVLFSTHITTDVEKIADYITYIKNGNIEFSKPVIDVMNDFILVKGNGNQIPDVFKNEMIGGKANTYNYEVLLRKNHKLQPVWIQEEQPTLEQIMYFYERSD